MNVVKVNGKTYIFDNGSSISVNGDKVYVDGKRIDSGKDRKVELAEVKERIHTAATESKGLLVRLRDAIMKFLTT